jgi:hypothetical protein
MVWSENEKQTCPRVFFSLDCLRRLVPITILQSKSCCDEADALAFFQQICDFLINLHLFLVLLDGHMCASISDFFVVVTFPDLFICQFNFEG